MAKGLKSSKSNIICVILVSTASFPPQTNHAIWRWKTAQRFKHQSNAFFTNRSSCIQLLLYRKSRQLLRMQRRFSGGKSSYGISDRQGTYQNWHYQWLHQLVSNASANARLSDRSHGTSFASSSRVYSNGPLEI